ncbi:unnamed protein product [Chondrus crispus]|uniref:Integrase catalytic domain-containing protein n=1 Tax=Chondrus crispus TaxID=2769 RepID=R7QQ42_CHOCR|nr:unnamed protein product [Chondrus crispus]CDF39893.1 unnamed protein product [Chondrus crispus]|eukprot:XP_005710187.1 unnamed protein product [Chondrus crispus]
MDDQSSGSVRIEKLTASNFYIWKQKIQLLLALRDVDQYVLDDIPENATSDDRRKWIRGDAKAKAVIGLTLSDDYLHHVRECSSAKETWEAILNVFERHTLLNKLAARRDFHTVSMLPSEKVLVFINRVKQLAARLQSMSVEIDDKEIAMAVLNGLPPRFDNLIVALDALGNEDKVFGLEFVKSRLLQEEQRESMKTASASSPHAPALVNHGFRSRNTALKPSAFVSRNDNSTAAFAESNFTCLLSTSTPEKRAANARSWLVDSGCSAHITFDRSLFVTYEQMQSGSVEMGTKARANVAGRGEVELMLNVNGSPHPCKLSNVLHVPDFGYSLLSVTQMVSKGLQVSFENEKYRVTTGPTVTLHERMAHVNVQGIASMIHNNVVSGINSDNHSPICPACVFGKATRSVIPKQRSSSRAQNCLDLVHSDVCGPLEVQSIGDLNGTQHQLTTAYIPEQNGVAERLNRTLIDLVHSMLSHKQVSKRFWAEALATSVYVRNRVTSRTLPVNATPHHIWMNSTPNVGHLRVFGSKCWYTLPKLELRKLDLRAREAMFLGYSQCSKAYKLWDGELNKIVVSRDVKFDESTSDTPNTNEVGSEEDEVSEEVLENDGAHSVSENDEDEDDVPTAVENPNVTPPTPTPAVRRSSRATNGPRAAFWQTGIDKELASQTKNRTWKLVPPSEVSNILTSRWVFNVKQLPDANGNIVESAKARLVARGFQQVQGLDYTETYAPVIKFTTIRLLLALVAHYDLELHQMDVVTAFLNGDLDEDIYMEQPEGCIDKSKSDHVCKLLKALYDLKQAHRQWHAKVNDFLIGELGFETSRSDPCLFIKRIGNTIMLIALYVDDLLLAGSDIDAIKWMKGELNKRFEMKDLGKAKVCIGLEIERDRSAKTLSHTTTISTENDSETNVPYREAVGSLMYLMVGTRPDLAYAIGKLSQHSANPCESHWAGVKRVMRYVQGTRNLGIVFDNKSKSPEFSRKQTVVATSTCEAEYIALCEACKEATWLRQVVADVLGLDSDPTIMMGCDNAGTISYAENESVNRRNKHVDVKYHYVRDAIKRNVISLSHCPTTSMPADILTKALGRVLFQKFVELLGLAVATSDKSM